jgi:GntR family transcriptional repressor for pyruvate dehydrogenase complex
MALTDEAISRIRTMIQSGQLPPGARLPPEHELATQMGISRSGIREAVKVLAAARVLDVRRGDGTYVTSLEPALLLQGVGFAIELLRGETLLEVVEVRRLLEPAATALAAARVTDRQLTELGELVRRMRGVAADAGELMRCDIAFHRAVIAATGNETLASLLDGLSGRTVRARVWRGLVLGDAAQKTIDEHEAIYRALAERNQWLAHAAALVHVTTSESWLRTVVDPPPDQEPGP